MDYPVCTSAKDLKTKKELKQHLGPEGHQIDKDIAAALANLTERIEKMERIEKPEKPTS